jgi:hypothetical protein
MMMRSGTPKYCPPNFVWDATTDTGTWQNRTPIMQNTRRLKLGRLGVCNADFTLSLTKERPCHEDHSHKPK